MNPAPPVTRRRRYARVAPTGSGDRSRDRWREAAVGVVRRGHLGRAEQRRHGPGVRPVTLVDGAVETSVGDVVVEHVGDLELAATRRQEVVDDRERVAPQEIHADRDQVALGVLGLLLEPDDAARGVELRSEEHTSELQSHVNLVCRLLLEKKKKNKYQYLTDHRRPGSGYSFCSDLLPRLAFHRGEAHL